ncbi:MAG: IS21 family transposase [Lachnospiraceae bacterium]|nr:IS21 family transposase [Lachnospiraceae bacterium]
MINKIKGELAVMDILNVKPNYAALGRKYDLDWRTVKKYHQGYEGRPATRNKGSKLDQYKNEITDKLLIKRTSVKGVYQFMIKKYGFDRIGSYSNFNRYISINKLKPKDKIKGHPRYEKGPGEQCQVDWKEDIHITNKSGETYIINVLHVVLKYSRYSYLELSVQKRFDDVARGLINSFIKFGGVPKELLFDNMSTVANTSSRPKKLTDSIIRMSKDFAFKAKLCRVRSPETKGTVEARNKIIDWIRVYDKEFETIEDLQKILIDINNSMNIAINQETQMSPTALFYKEKEYLLPLPTRSIVDTYLSSNKYKVSSEALIRYGNSKYSVDPKLIGEEVTVDLLDNKLYIYYNGKLITLHEINKKPINYKKDHYEKLMKGKVDENDMEAVINDNLEKMDRILETRKVTVSEKAAMKSEEALIAYINQSEYGRWVINNYANLSYKAKSIFIKSINEVLPYINNKEQFISHIKYSMKSDYCKTIAFNCLIEDTMRMDESSNILTDEGIQYFSKKYEDEMYDYYENIAKQQIEYEKEKEEIKSKIQSDNSDSMLIPKLDELPFD